MENERCKDCEHCEYYINGRDKKGSVALFILVLDICLMFGAVFYVFKKAVTPNREVDIGGYKVKIKDNSIADTLIDSGLYTADDIQKMIDELLEQ